MNIKKDGASDLWNIIGSFGELDADAQINGNTFLAENGSIKVTSRITEYDNGVFVRCTKVKNISDNEVVLNTLSSKFTFDGGEYEIYTQSNCWQNESEGGWQPLITSVSAQSKSVRNASGAAPFMVLWSGQQNRGIAFHLNAYSAWEMRASKIYFAGEITLTEVDLGVANEGLALKLMPGEEAELPEIIYYDVLNRIDMDCWKLHSYLNKEYPRRELPVIYNSWLYKFDRFTYGDIIEQIKRAKELGVEYFVIDAGWFGDGEDWWNSRGDWEENQTFGFRGRMCEIAQEVRKHGMKFGFWLEPESASEGSEVLKNHPDYFLKGRDSYFIDFANDDAKEYIFDVTCKLIDRFGAEFVKFDFNADLNFDKYRTGFINYFNGHRDYIKKLKEKYPSLYIENCASGGMRMSVRDGKVYDGFWPTDNQSPYRSLRIFKDSLLRMPPQWIEGWISVKSAENFSYLYGSNDMADKLFATNDATWSNIVSVDTSFLSGFMTGRPVSLSFDLTQLSQEVFTFFKKYIEEFKNDRDFWRNAVCHILTDTPTMLVLEFRNSDFSKAEIVVFSGTPKQNNICVYPVLDYSGYYEINGEYTKEAYEILKQGINIPITASYSAQTIKIIKTEE